MANSVIVNSKDLGTSCWLTGRFCPGVRCNRVYECKYPEKATCKAIDAERAHLDEVQRQGTVQYIEKLNKLNQEVENARKRLQGGEK